MASRRLLALCWVPTPHFPGVGTFPQTWRGSIVRRRAPFHTSSAAMCSTSSTIARLNFGFGMRMNAFDKAKPFELATDALASTRAPSGSAASPAAPETGFDKPSKKNGTGTCSNCVYCGPVLRHPAELLPAVDLGGRVWLGGRSCKGWPAAPAFVAWAGPAASKFAGVCGAQNCFLARLTH